MQLMSWTLARLGSRFGLHFEPHRRRVLHSALGRFCDQPLDLMVGMEEPDGTRRVLPLSADGQLLANPEQFERLNSITFRGFSERYRLRFEFNVHSVFYPQDERLCLMPVFYLEMRIHPVPSFRWERPSGPTPEKVKLFIRLRRHDTEICADPGSGKKPARIDMVYQASPTPEPVTGQDPNRSEQVAVHERLLSLNPGCELLEQGDGLALTLPVTDDSSGIKWRMVWAAHVSEPALQVDHPNGSGPARFRYAATWPTLDDVMTEAVERRDERLARSRRLEKLLEQAPLDPAHRHLLNQSFQSMLSNSYWMQVEPEDGSGAWPWFSVLEGTRLYHSPIDAEYNGSLFYLSMWPDLLSLQLRAWAGRPEAHEASGGCWLRRDLGRGDKVAGPAYPYAMHVEHAADFLLLLDAYTRWTGDRSVATSLRDLVEGLAKYLLWSDREETGFPTEGIVNTLDDGLPAVQFARGQTYLAVKRITALRAVGALLSIDEPTDLGVRCSSVAEADAEKIEAAAWLGDHYAVCVDKSGLGVYPPGSQVPLAQERLDGWDGYSIYTGNGVLLPLMTGHPLPLDKKRLQRDLAAATRECRGRYGCGHTSAEPESIWVSQNLWRDALARYMKVGAAPLAQLYWDLQVMSNTHAQSLGFADAYVHNNLAYNPRGVSSFGVFLAGPRLVIDRLAASGPYIAIDPDRHMPQRWPLLALADWKAGKIPVCVVDESGRVLIEGETDPVIVLGEADGEPAVAGAGGLGAIG
ncbi:glutaminase domain-containing protein [Mucisphaera sp.]|uniref:glutaminase domain-containing protein n=1 Tax=Mucisphaera sp. TaxID=2913024 RepID=UPI003D0A0B16